ncbi:cleavage and polyadenylation specificity factor subunit 2 [Apophysomyces sp. BC1034]|nr:cleavage and polyadenylation specificity factor subunit 2 [Apophysomyces sp. BC1015]KAG0176397.1 cleavage and polyadenylation specificity factor subunit 2 [Apophysomyces sp. BC1021]KAG0193623.1 cleavage and polyadenylation specificity factor subunit 2 [Apophysomyces sp. BC1034]
MTSYIKFTPISGAKNEDALCYLLEIDEVKILLDCGWSDKFEIEDLANLKKVAKQIDVVLLSHCDLHHLGAYPYARGHLGLACPVYSTVPVVNLGKMCMYDLYQSKTNEMEFETFSLEDVDNAFDKITSLRYSQPCALPGKCQGITITAYAAAHTIGGTIWKIKQDTDEIVYAVDFNHRKECHLDGTALYSGGVMLDALTRPSLLITDALNASVIHPPRREDRYAAMFDTMISSLEKGGSVLLPTDSSARVLELSYLLDQHWTFYQLNYPLIMLTNTSYHTAHFAKSMLEWMGDDLTKKFSQTRENPYEFKYLRLCHKIEDLDNYPGPKVVIASNNSLETGFARQVFLRWMSSQQQVKNTLILTDRSAPGSLARQMYKEWDLKSENMVQSTPGSTKAPVKPAIEYQATLNLRVFGRVPLEGAELQAYEAEQRAKAERDAAQAAMIARSKTIMEEDESDTSDIDEADDAMDDVLMTQHDLYVKDAGRSGGFFKQAQSYRMFPYLERRKRIDDYGESIQVEHYMKASDMDQMQSRKQQLGEGANFAKEDEMEVDIQEPILPGRDETPTKYISTVDDVEISCLLRYVDLEGLSDGKSVKTILPQIAPRKLIVVHGQESSTEDLLQACQGMDHFTKEIFTPSVGEVLNVSAATNIYRVKLTDAMVSSLQFSKLDDYELARVTGKIHFPEDTTTPSLDVAVSDEPSKWEPSVFVGDIKLTEFKRILQTEGISAEFKGEGVLVCNDQVAVRKTGTGQLLVEGLLSADYYKIRSLLYAQHAIL